MFIKSKILFSPYTLLSSTFFSGIKSLIKCLENLKKKVKNLLELLITSFVHFCKHL